jgi:hypothetical protein
MAFGAALGAVGAGAFLLGHTATKVRSSSKVSRLKSTACANSISE